MRGTASRGTLRSEVKEEAEGRGTRAEKSPPVSRAFTNKGRSPVSRAFTSDKTPPRESCLHPKPPDAPKEIYGNR